MSDELSYATIDSNDDYLYYLAAIKLAQVERYRLRLKERDRRKQIGRDFNLITDSAQAAAAAIAAAIPANKLAKSPHPKSPIVKKKTPRSDRYWDPIASLFLSEDENIGHASLKL